MAYITHLITKFDIKMYNLLTPRSTTKILNIYKIRKPKILV